MSWCGWGVTDGRIDLIYRQFLFDSADNVSIGASIPHWIMHTHQCKLKCFSYTVVLALDRFSAP